MIISCVSFVCMHDERVLLAPVILGFLSQLTNPLCNQSCNSVLEMLSANVCNVHECYLLPKHLGLKREL